MQHDTIIWDIISPGRGGFCSFRRKLPGVPTRFCKNAYNVLGICHPNACPLANSRYATIREHKGECYLLMKTIERAHSPSKHWQKIKLSKDYMTALRQIDENLIWWPKWYIHKCKLRLTKIHQFLIRSRKLALSVQPKLVRIWKPYERQQRNREQKAEIAAKITNVVKSELMERLHEGVYEGIYNFPMQQYNEILDEKGAAENEDNSEANDDEIDIEIDSPQQQPAQGDEIPEFIADFEGSEAEEDDMEDMGDKMPQYEYEYEYETDGQPMATQTQTMASAASGFRSSSSSTSTRTKPKPKGQKKKRKAMADVSEEELKEDISNFIANFSSSAMSSPSSQSRNTNNAGRSKGRAKMGVSSDKQPRGKKQNPFHSRQSTFSAKKAFGATGNRNKGGKKSKVKISYD